MDTLKDKVLDVRSVHIYSTAANRFLDVALNIHLLQKPHFCPFPLNKMGITRAIPVGLIHNQSVSTQNKRSTGNNET